MGENTSTQTHKDVKICHFSLFEKAVWRMWLIKHNLYNADDFGTRQVWQSESYISFQIFQKLSTNEPR